MKNTVTKTILLIAGLLFLTNICNGQDKKINICKVDSASQRVFVYLTRADLQDYNSTTKIIKRLESDFKTFNDLCISFFDDIENCGYKVETNGSNPEDFTMKINNVKSHWIAEYSLDDRILNIYEKNNAPIIEMSFKVE